MELRSASLSSIHRALQASRCFSSTSNTSASITIPAPNASRPQTSTLGSLGQKIKPSQDGKVTSYMHPVTPEHHLHVFATRHNTHLTLSDTRRKPLISISCGNLGFRKSARGTYDASYQLGTYLINRMAQDGLVMKIHKLELILRGYGPGREAIQKILLGTEGMILRPLVHKVTDATRLKFGGTRSRKPRRL